MHKQLAMMLTLGVATCIALPAAGQFVGPGMTIPVVANLPGLNNTFWMTDVTVLNLGDSSTDVLLQLFPEIVGGEGSFEPMTSTIEEIPPGGEVVLSNVVQTTFGQFNTKGSLLVYSFGTSELIVTSRTYTFGGCGGGSYGQNVIGTVAANEAFLGGMRHDAMFRTNIGVFWPIDTADPVSFTITVFTPDGSRLASGSLSFNEPGLQQISLSNLGIDSLAEGWVRIQCSDPELVWYAYGSRVDQATGDAVYQSALSRQRDLP